MADQKQPPTTTSSDRLLQISAVLAAMIIIGAVVILDAARDGTLEPTSIGLLTGVLGPVITILVLKGSSSAK